MTTKTILLINSEPNVREVVQDCLSHLGGWQVLSTGSLSEGLQRAILDQPDAIILDLSMSDTDHFIFLQELRMHAATQLIPVVLMTADAKWLGSRRLYQLQVAGAIDYVSEPARLLQQVAMLLHWDEALQPIEVED